MKLSGCHGFKPQLNPNVTELEINEGEPLNITCTSNSYVNFYFPTSDKRGRTTSQPLITPEVRSTHKTFIRLSSVFGDTGWYGCADESKQITSMTYKNYSDLSISWVYVYTSRKVSNTIRVEEKGIRNLVNLVTSELIIDNVTHDDRGNYTCKIRSSFDEKESLDTHVCVFDTNKPYINLTSDNLNIHSDDSKSVTFVALVDACPIPTLKWTHPRGYIIRSHLRKVIMSDYGTMSRLTLLNIDEDDTGFFTLTAKHDKIVKELKFYLDVHGNYEDWESFSGLFESLVHEVGSIPDVNKLQYLKSCLTGVASNLVKDVALKGENYTSTWKTLRERFCNPRLTINNLLNALYALPHLTRESAKDLRTFSDEAQRIVRALEILKMPVQHWNVWLIHLLSGRLDTISRKAWELDMSATDRSAVARASVSSTELNALDRFPTFAKFIEFIENRVQGLSMLGLGSRVTASNPALNNNQGASNTGPIRKAHLAKQLRSLNSPACPLCNGVHPIWKCPQFKALTPFERKNEARRFSLCFNCLGNHRFDACKSIVRCLTCKDTHHTLLHLEKPKSLDQRNVSGSNLPPPKGSDSGFNVKSYHSAPCLPISSVILATAQIEILGPSGTIIKARALLDQGSESSFVTESMVQLLRLPKIPIQITLEGIGASHSGVSKAIVTLRLRSLRSTQLSLEFSALVLPRLTSHLSDRSSPILQPSSIRKLELADPEFWKGGSVDVILGADVYGKLLKSGLKRFPNTNLIAQNTTLGWIVSGIISESLPRRAVNPGPQSIHVLHTTYEDHLSISSKGFGPRDRDGRYMVQLPLKEGIPPLGRETRQTALATLTSLHRRLTQDSWLRDQYHEFLTCYEAQGHMAKVPPAAVNNPTAWYLPHHAVVTVDIVRMFRQIRMEPAHQDYQRILWAPSPDVPPVDYRLTTVTYGTNCAPFLAIRTLRQLATDERHKFPQGAQIIEEGTYVDDMFVGDDTLSGALHKRKELISILATAGMTLDKWSANHPDLIPTSKCEGPNGYIKGVGEDGVVKILGLQWNPSKDEFTFQVTPPEDLKGNVTKLVKAKFLMQDLWILRCGWDEPIPVEMRKQWISYCESLPNLNELTIPRWIGTSTDQKYELNGFSGSSKQGMAADLYLKVTTKAGGHHSNLLISKTKVAPVKTLSIPNLELCAAALLVKLIRHIRNSDFFRPLPVFAWTDSQIVLDWLNKHPRQLKTFVANRVAFIQTKLPTATWSHVPSSENPADLASQGCTPSSLIGSRLWWYGPSWLLQDPPRWPVQAQRVRVFTTISTPKEP
ncbi:uncharacterized protein LOC106641333 [Copidosoma floridanum]|uniref:uncharacterized protein LOC106641333 n=1 Tax=Copidosoma floridanum TaxID=29053 RepID=UPI0006C95F6A|nr:uncharacterized protein LOC106641333 [Copidosoma floridanum]